MEPMREESAKSWGPWILRAAVAVQCLAFAWQLGHVEQSALFGWLWGQQDVGGLGLAESTAAAIQTTVAWLLLASAVVVIWRPFSVVLGFVLVFQLTTAAAMWQKSEGFQVRLDWLGDSPWYETAFAIAGLFPFAAQAARIAAPLVLLLVERTRCADVCPAGNSSSAEWIARIAIAATFGAHGLEALQQNPDFIDLLIHSFENLGTGRMSEAAAGTLLYAIGVVDIVVAVAMVAVRSRAIAGYMAFWGLITAASRIVCFGLERGWPGFAERSSHFALPLVLLLCWHLARSASSAAADHADESSERG